ncbi:PAS domain S-box protein [Corallococcus sp. ZKHCc1 1396]|uniref:histidine kinase n=1 Tax=Corallococcus soli TaxID=2710757 RepID=A0ABR9PWW8_9BACT|nr:GAF domain-containing sensor histidine kinase [Corallococcus soli]MBE4752369.1 PAS domain S-box protein [Corallococcus soli]
MTEPESNAQALGRSRSESLRQLQWVLAGLVPAASAASIWVGALALMGWVLGIPSLILALSASATGVMTPDLALGMIATGAALRLLHADPGRGWRRMLGRGLALGAMALGLGALGWHALGGMAGAHRLLLGVRGGGPSVPSGWAVSGGALGLCLTGLALLLLHVRTRWGGHPARWLALCCALMASWVLFGFLFWEPGAGTASRGPGTTASTAMGPHSALLLLLLALAILSVHPERGLMGMLLREDLGGLLARRLLPTVILAPLVVGGARLLGTRLDFFGTPLGITLFAGLTMLAFLAAAFWNAKVLSGLDARSQQAEEVLRNSEERFRTSFEDAPIGMSLVDLDGRFLNVNASLLHILGYSRAELLSRTFQDLTVPEDLGVDLMNVRRLLQGDIDSYQMEKRYIHKDGHAVSTLLTASMVRDAQGAPLHFISQIQDITERKQLEHAWRLLAEAGPRLAESLETRTTLATVVELAVPALADWCLADFEGEDGRVRRVEVSAATPELERRLRAMLQAYPLNVFRRGGLTASVLRTGKPVLMPEVSDAALEAAAVDAAHLESLRRLAPLSGIIVPLRIRERLVGVVILATSVSGRRYGTRDLALAEELARRAALALDNAQLLEKSAQAIRVRDEVLRIVAHDLRAPLNVIALSAGVLRKGLPEIGAARRPLESVEKSLQRANRLIQDLLDVARLEGGGLSVEREALEVAPLIREAVELHRALVEARSLQLVASIPEALPAVFADRERALQIFSNLIGNALKFTPEGGKITLRVQAEGGWVRFSVRDTGPGISPKELPHLFEPFWQSRAKRKEGAGLGLAIVKGLVDAHGGQLGVESHPGAGSTFFFTLPAALAAEAHAPAPA